MTETVLDAPLYRGTVAELSTKNANPYARFLDEVGNEWVQTGNSSLGVNGWILTNIKGALKMHLASSDIGNMFSRALTVLDETTDLSANNTPNLWLPTESLIAVTISASTNSTAGSLDVEYSVDGGATTEAVTSTKTLTSGDAVISSGDGLPNGTSPVSESLFKLFPYFRPKITGASASSTGTIKVVMRGIQS